MATNNNPAITSGDNSTFVATRNGDIGDKSQLMPRKATNNIENQNKTRTFLAMFGSIGFHAFCILHLYGNKETKGDFTRQQLSLGINESTLWYMKRNIAAGKSLKIYDKVYERLSLLQEVSKAREWETNG